MPGGGSLAGADREARQSPGRTGTFVFSADDSPAPTPRADDPIAAPDGPLGPLYAGKLVEVEPGDWRFMAFRGDGDRDFVGELTDPLPLRIDDADGSDRRPYPDESG